MTATVSLGKISPVLTACPFAVEDIENLFQFGSRVLFGDVVTSAHILSLQSFPLHYHKQITASASTYTLLSLIAIPDPACQNDSH